MTQEKARRYGSWWHCLNCKDKDLPEMTFEKICKHLIDEHKIDTAVTKARRRTVLRMDGAFFYSSSHEITIGDVKLQQYECNPRHRLNLKPK